MDIELQRQDVRTQTYGHRRTDTDVRTYYLCKSVIVRACLCLSVFHCVSAFLSVSVCVRAAAGDISKPKQFKPVATSVHNPSKIRQVVRSSWICQQCPGVHGQALSRPHMHSTIEDVRRAHQTKTPFPFSRQTGYLSAYLK